MDKKRIYELSKEIRVDSKKILDKAKEKGFDVKNHMSTLGEDEEKQMRDFFAKNKNNHKKIIITIIITTIIATTEA